MNEGKIWHLYLLQCLDNSYYIGITNDLDKRMKAHKSGKGSKYVRAKGFDCLISSKVYNTKSEALKAEYRLKQLSRGEKREFFNH
jgi:putative endonuclease